MNVPLDNLYNWVQGFASRPVMLYVFQPHGSKDIFDLVIFTTNTCSSPQLPTIICHDQEPLDFDSHELDLDYDLEKAIKFLSSKQWSSEEVDLARYLFSNVSLIPELSLTWLNLIIWQNNSPILLHSEYNSRDVEQFAQKGFCPVYYWSHAVIARDWYRFAQYDSRLQHKKVEKTFLIYCRDWTPLREYRLKFLDLLVKAQDLLGDCIVSTQHVNNQGIHLKDYHIQDPRFAVDTHSLLVVPDNTCPATYSANYDAKDICSTAISVVLETVVDGTKIHLTEKILRAIACGHPFVLVAGPGALAYLRSYGFRTFGDVFDESYDHEADIVTRLEMVISTMQQIQHLTDLQWKEINEIAKYNQSHFFSEDFVAQVSSELKTNLNQAIDSSMETCGDTMWKIRKYLRRTKQTHMMDRDYQTLSNMHELRRIRSKRFQNKSIPIIGQ